TAQPFALCEFGHQGLAHDEEFALIYNRARMIVPEYGRFGKRDQRKYVDGANLFEYVKSCSPNLRDATGQNASPICINFHCANNAVTAAVTVINTCPAGFDTYYDYLIDQTGFILDYAMVCWKCDPVSDCNENGKLGKCQSAITRLPNLDGTVFLIHRAWC